MEDPIVSDVVIENRTVVGSIFHDNSMFGTGKEDDPLGVNREQFLSSNGGTLTGAIKFEWSGNYPTTPKTILKTKYNIDDGIVVESDVLTVAPNGEATFNHPVYSSGLRPVATSGGNNLGTTLYCFGATFTQKLNAGSQNGVDSGDLIVPTVGGTIARIEDIDTVVGDISTALTAILGE